MRAVFARVCSDSIESTAIAHLHCMTWGGIDLCIGTTHTHRHLIDPRCKPEQHCVHALRRMTSSAENSEKPTLAADDDEATPRYLTVRGRSLNSQSVSSLSESPVTPPVAARTITETERSLSNRIKDKIYRRSSSGSARRPSSRTDRLAVMAGCATARTN